MSKAKKFLLIAFTVGLVINLQFNAPLTRNMDNGFSVEQLAENIFVPEAFATITGWCKEDGCRSGDNFCEMIVFPDFLVTCYDDGWPFQ